MTVPPKFRLPNIENGTYTWYAQLIDPANNQVISEDIAEWTFLGTSAMVVSDEDFVDILGE
ncbi:MAG: hypothetical protein ACE5J3_07965 [Methanosarcinales archaeon]